MNLAKKYGHIIKVHPPENYGPNPEDLKKYNLPLNLESYIQTPASTIIISNENSKKNKAESINLRHTIHCSKCPKRFANTTKLESHDLLKHSSHYRCTYCEKAYQISMVEEFKIHMYRHEKMNVKAHECIHCGYSSYITKSMISHINQQGPFHTNSCGQCQKKFQNFQNFKNHMESDHPGLPTWICSTCVELFLNLENLRLHQLKDNKVNNNKSEICEFCGKTFTGSLSQHISRTHKKIGELYAYLYRFRTQITFEYDSFFRKCN